MFEDVGERTKVRARIVVAVDWIILEAKLG